MSVRSVRTKPLARPCLPSQTAWLAALGARPGVDYAEAHEATDGGRW